MESSRLFKIPSELREEVLSHVSLKDIANFYRAYKLTPSHGKLEQLAIRFRLPVGVSIETLIALQEFPLHERIRLCVQMNDIPSFTRLFRQYRAEIDEVNVLLLQHQRHEIARIYVTTLMMRAHLRGEENIWEVLDIIIYQGDLEMLELHLDHEPNTEISYDTLARHKDREGKPYGGLQSEEFALQLADMKIATYDLLLVGIELGYLRLAKKLLDLGCNFDLNDLAFQTLVDEMLALILEYRRDDRAVDLVVKHAKDVPKVYQLLLAIDTKLAAKFVHHLVTSGRLSSEEAEKLVQDTQTVTQPSGDEL